MARPAVIGPQIYEAVEKLTADGQMTKTNAFKVIAQNPGEYGVNGEDSKSPGTVAASYYRLQRSKVAGEKPKAATSPRKAAETTRKAKPVPTDGDLADQLVRMAEAAAEMIRQEREESQMLRERLARISETLGA